MEGVAPLRSQVDAGDAGQRADGHPETAGAGTGAPGGLAGTQVSRDNLGRHKRRSWGCLLRSVASMGSVGTLGSVGSMSLATVAVGATVGSPSGAEQEQQLFYPSPLAERSPGDPFQGRSTEIPTRGPPQPPPPYEEALETTVRLMCAPAAPGADAPLLSRLRRSLTDRGDAFRAGRASWSATPSWNVLGDVPETLPRTPRRCSETPPPRAAPCINMETSL